MSSRVYSRAGLADLHDRHGPGLTAHFADCSRRLVKPYRHPGAGAITAIQTPDGVAYERYGRIDAAHPESPDPQTIFEIGSITKVFTSVLLSKLAIDGRIDPDAPIATIRPEFSCTPAWITPRALATHTSGLPRLPFSKWQVMRMGPKNP